MVELRGTNIKKNQFTVALYVDFDGTKTWNGNVVASMADLDGYFRNAATRPVPPEIQLG